LERQRRLNFLPEVQFQATTTFENSIIAGPREKNTHLRCGGIFSDYYKFSPNSDSEIILKSVNTILVKLKLRHTKQWCQFFGPPCKVWCRIPFFSYILAKTDPRRSLFTTAELSLFIDIAQLSQRPRCMDKFLSKMEDDNSTDILGLSLSSATLTSSAFKAIEFFELTQNESFTPFKVIQGLWTRLQSRGRTW